MSILKKLEDDLKVALKAKNPDKLAAVRLIKNVVKNKEIELMHALSETEFYAVLATMVKQRQESIEQFTKGGRDDLVQKEQGEISVIQSYLPQPFTPAEVQSLIDQAVLETQAKSPKDMGLVMKALKDKTSGRVDGKLLSEQVRQKLGSL